MKSYTNLLIVFFFTVSIFAQLEEIKFPILKGEYFGQITPSSKAEVFAPGVISTGNFERDFTMSPDQNEIYYSCSFLGFRYITIMFSKKVDGIWTEPQTASFATNYDYAYMEPHITPDGNQIMFLSTMPVDGQQPKPGWGNQNIWVADRLENGDWSTPYPLAIKGRVEFYNYFPSVTNEGTVYFTRNAQGKKTPQLFRAKMIGGKYTEPEILPDAINGTKNIVNAFISPDESYLIGCVSNHKNNSSKGVADYIMFFRNEEDQWSEGINLGPEINLPNVNATSAYVSPDNQYLFFSMSLNNTFEDFDNRITNKKLIEMTNSPGNGDSDIYWIKTDFIKELKQKAVFVK